MADFPYERDVDEAHQRAHRARSRSAPRRLHALTLVQPWAYAIARLGKPIENRTWTPPEWLIGGYLAIHAGKKLDEDALTGLVLEGHEVPEEHVHGAIVAVARVIGWVRTDGKSDHAATYMRDVPLPPDVASSPWFIGPVGWVLDNVTAIEPVPCRGAQKLWIVPAEPADEVRRRWKEARRAA